MSAGFAGRTEGGLVVGATPNVTLFLDSIAGHLLVAGMAFSSTNTFSSFDDAAGNTWIQAGTEFNSGGNKFRTYYAYNCIGSVGNSYNLQTSLVGGSYLAVAIAQFSGMKTATDPLEDFNTASGSGTAIASASLAMSAPEGIIFAFMAANSNGLVGGTGYDLQDFNATGDATKYYGSERKIVTAGEAAEATCTSAGWVIQAASFQAEPGGGGGSLFWWENYVKQRTKARWRNNGLIWTPSYAA